MQYSTFPSKVTSSGVSCDDGCWAEGACEQAAINVSFPWGTESVETVSTRQHPVIDHRSAPKSVAVHRVDITFYYDRFYYYYYYFYYYDRFSTNGRWGCSSLHLCFNDVIIGYAADWKVFGRKLLLFGNNICVSFINIAMIVMNMEHLLMRIFVLFRSISFHIIMLPIMVCNIKMHACTQDYDWN